MAVRVRRLVGPNQLMEETLQLFCDPRWGVKESQVCGWGTVCG